MIPEGFIKDRVETLASKIYHDQISAGHDQLDLIVIMNSAFRFFTDLLAALNRQSEKPGQKPLKIRISFVKVTTYHLMEGVVSIDEVRFELVSFHLNAFYYLGLSECC